MFTIIFLILALICFIIATVGVVAKVNWIALGLAFVTFSWLLSAFGVHS